MVLESMIAMDSLFLLTRIPTSKNLLKSLRVLEMVVEMASSVKFSLRQIIKEVLPTFFREISVKGSTYLSGILAFLLISIVIAVGFVFMQKQFIKLKSQAIFWATGLVLSLIGFLSLPDRIEGITERTFGKSSEDRVEVMNIDTTGVDSNALQWMHWIYPDIQISATLDRENHLEHLGKRWIYDFYKQKKLVQKPDVYLLFVESYGCLLYTSDAADE